MRVSDSAPIEEYLRILGRRLNGPARLKADLLAEARDGLTDAAEAYQEMGLDARTAQRRAVAEFGGVRELAADYQAELAATALRTLALRVIVVATLLISLADLIWQGAPWTGRPLSAGYLLVSGSLDVVWIGCVVLAVTSYAWLSWTARRGRFSSLRLTRVVARGIAASVALTWLGGLVIYGWSVRLWTEAVTWPPMIVGGVGVTAAYVWLACAVLPCLSTTRFTPAPPVNCPDRGTGQRST